MPKNDGRRCAHSLPRQEGRLCWEAPAAVTLSRCSVNEGDGLGAIEGDGLNMQLLSRLSMREGRLCAGGAPPFKLSRGCIVEK